MDFIYHFSSHITQGYLSSWVAMLLAGSLFALNPCPLATHISAILYFFRKGQSSSLSVRHTLFYILGRWTCYFVLWLVALLLFRVSMQALHLQEKILSYGEHVVGPILVLFGLFLLLSHRIPFLHFHVSASVERKVNSVRYARLRAFLMGVVFALGFCPVTALLFFGGMLPVTQDSPYGFALFLLFSLLAILPAFLFLFLYVWGMKNFQSFFSRIENFQKKLQIGVAYTILILGLFVSVSHFFFHHH